MLKIGHRPTIDAALASAEQRLLRLQQMENDARVVFGRWERAHRFAVQDRYGTSECDHAERMVNRAYIRLKSVCAAVDEQKTKVRLIREGRLDHA